MPTTPETSPDATNETEDEAFNTVGTSVSTSFANGVHPRVVQEHLGHAHISITLQIYSHVQPTMHDEAAVLVANLILPQA